MPGLIDVHCHLLPGVDDGCASIDESIACARGLVAEGYTHAFCTPHIWPSLPHNNVREIPQRTKELQNALNEANVALHLLPGGELNLRPQTPQTPPDEVLTYGLGGKYCLFDMWADELPDWFDGAIGFLQSLELNVIVAHPERMRAVQENPGLVDRFADMGLLLQGNLQCFSDPPNAATRQLVEEFLVDGRYFVLGSDTHNPQTLPLRMEGLRRAVALAGQAAVDRLTIENPRNLLPRSAENL